MTFYSLFVFALLALVSSLAIASDPSPLHNFCVATKKSQCTIFSYHASFFAVYMKFK